MKDTTNAPEKASRDTSDDDILKIGRARLDTAIGALSNSRKNQLEDLRFAAGSSDNNWQWPEGVIATRTASGGDAVGARPTLTINKLPQHIKQITNDQRQNRPAGEVIPVNGDADVDMAEVYGGIVKHIEYISDADVAYDTACENQVTHGEGFIRLVTDYVEEDSFDQDILIKRVRNPFSIYMDPMIQDPCGADAEWCWVLEDLSHEEYQAQYKDATPISTLKDIGEGNSNRWLTDKTVRIGEYFYYETTSEKLYQFPNGETAFGGTTKYEGLEAAYGKPTRSRKSDRKKLKWVKTNGYEILAQSDWLGKHIPVIRVVGNEFEVDGELFVTGIVRNAKDAQRMYNYWASQEAEMLALAPKAPFIGYSGQFEGYEHKWKTANVQNWAYLEANSDVTDGEGRLAPLPQRSMPPMAQQGLIAAKQGAAEDIKATTGQYNASLGMTSNERSGKAILARQHEGDVGTYHYGDNLARAVRYLTRQLVDLIPKIYDTARIARIIAEDGATKMVEVNPEQPEAVQKIQDERGNTIKKIYNPAVGRYDVRVATGPGYATKRQQALDAMVELLQGNPQLWAMAGDLIVKNMDWPGAQELSKRLGKAIDPKLLAEDGENPELQQAQQQIEELSGQLQQAIQMVQNAGQSMEAQELSIKKFEAQVKAYQAETQRLQVMQAGLTADQVQDIVRGTIDAAVQTGDLSPGMPPAPPMERAMMVPPPEAPQPQMGQEQPLSPAPMMEGM